MKLGFNVVYVVDGALYVNVTNRCTNNCDFCIRKNADGAYGSDSLWLLREPTAGEILRALEKYDLTQFKELVFCGYGEPSLRLDVCRMVALDVKKKHNIPVRINTNGHSTVFFGYNTAPLYKDAFDCVSISLNTPGRERYEQLCHPVLDRAYEGMLSFAKEVKKYVPKVLFSVVRDFLTEAELDECRKIADSCGVALKIRDYIS